MRLEAAADSSTASAAIPGTGATGPSARPLGGVGTAWYLQRLRRMSPQEVLWRSADVARKRAWRSRQGVTVDKAPAPVRAGRFTSPLPLRALDAVAASDVKRLRQAADEIMSGRWEVLGVTREDLVAPDWFLDPL